MFCGKCGTKNNDDAEFCTGCGAKLDKGLTENKVSLADAGKKNKRIGMAVVAFMVIILVTLVIVLFGGRSYKTTVAKYIDASNDGDAEKIMKLVPKKVIEYIIEEEDYDDIDDLIDDGNKYFKKYLDRIEEVLGEEWKASYEIRSVKDVTDEDLDDLREDYEDIGIKIKKAKVVKVKITVTADETESSNTMKIPVIKVGRSWYLDFINLGSIF